jgi:hypothetical protein
MEIKKQLKLCQEFSDYGDYRWDEDEEIYLFTPNYTYYGDYADTGLVGKSNYETFLEMFGKFPFVRTEFGYFGYNSIVLEPLALRHPEIIQTLKNLSDYPLLDEEHNSSLELDEFHESWESWASSDFKRGIVAAFELSEVTESFVEDLSHEKMMELFRSLDLNWEYASEGSGVTINIGGAIEKLTRSQLAKFLWEQRRKDSDK